MSLEGTSTRIDEIIDGHLVGVSYGFDVFKKLTVPVPIETYQDYMQRRWQQKRLHMSFYDVCSELRLSTKRIYRSQGIVKATKYLYKYGWPKVRQWFSESA